MIITAVILALIAAVCLAVATHLQQHAVAAQPPGRARTLTWTAGLVLMGLTTALNVAALGLGPVTIVQPIGALSLVVAAVISIRCFGLRLDRRVFTAIGLTLASIAVFVVISAAHASRIVIDDTAITALLNFLIIVSIAGASVAISRAGHLLRVAVTGIIFGTVAAAAHVLASSILTSDLPGLTLASPRWWMLAAALGLAALIGFALVQTAYASGPAETVLAGLTVIDPIVAVAIGAVLFGEYAGLSAAAGLGLSLAAAAGIAGVWMLARVHPRTLEATASGTSGAVPAGDQPTALTPPAQPAASLHEQGTLR